MTPTPKDPVEGDVMNGNCIDHGKKGDKQGRKAYALVRHFGKVQLMHRVVYCKAHGIDINSIKGLLVRHRCDNTRCINPDHLVLGTHADNMRDMADRRRQGMLKLTLEQVDEIRRTCRPNKPGVRTHNPYSYNALGRKFGVRNNAIRQVHLGMTHRKPQP